MTKDSGSPRPKDWLRIVIPFLVYVVLGVVGWKAGIFKGNTTNKISAQAGGFTHTPWFSVAYTLGYAGVATLGLPVGALAYAAGAIFGFVRGSLIIWCASMLGAAAGYVVARGVLASSARRLLGKHQEKLGNLRKGNVFLNAFRLQLMPIVPFAVFNYAAAIGKLRPFPFLAGTALGIIPGTLVAAYVGDRVIAGVTGDSRKPLFIAAAVAAALILVTFAPNILKKMKGEK